MGCMYMGSSLLLPFLAFAALQQCAGVAATAGRCDDCNVDGVEAAHRALLQTGSVTASSQLEQQQEDASKEHKSVFKIKYDDFNNTKFWCIATGLFFYTFFIHWLKKKVVGLTKDDEAFKVFIDQMFAEIMLFGVMAMSVFVSSQMFTMSMATFHIFELAHLLISFAAFLIITAGVILSRLRKFEDYYLKQIYKKSVSSTKRAIKAAKSISDLPSEVQDRAMLDITRAQFFMRQKLDGDQFSWSIYLAESVNSNVCKLIEIKHFTWLALFTLSIGIWGMHVTFGSASFVPAMSGPSASLTSYMTKLVAGNWISLLALVIVAVQARLTRLKMKNMLGASDLQQLRAAIGVDRHSPGVELFGTKNEFTLELLAHRCQVTFHVTQALVVGTSIMFGFYFMHVLYNLITFRMPLWWHVLFLVPPVLTYVVLLPLIIVQYTHVQSFADPDAEAIDLVIEAVNQAWHDLHFVQMQFEAKAHSQGIEEDSPPSVYIAWSMQQCEDADRNASKSGMVDGHFSQGDFARALWYMGVHVSNPRAKRLFKVINHEEPLMRYEEFLNHVFGQVEIVSRTLTNQDKHKSPRSPAPHFATLRSSDSSSILATST